MTMEDLERAAILQTLDRRSWNRNQAAEDLGISLRTLQRKLKQYREDSDGFTVSYKRAARAELSAAAEPEIRKALLQEKVLVDDNQLPISCYNYSALRDRLASKGVKVSVTTIIKP